MPKEAQIREAFRNHSGDLHVHFHKVYVVVHIHALVAVRTGGINNFCVGIFAEARDEEF